MHLKIDFSRKHTRFLMTDTPMKQVIRGDKLNKREPYNKDFFEHYFVSDDIEARLEFLLERVNSF